MHDFSLPPIVEPISSGGLADTVYEVAEETPDFPRLARRSGSGTGPWVTVTAAAFRDEVQALAKGLLASGVRFGDRVALMSRTRYEWTLFACALWSIGAQVVLVYPTSSSQQVRWILSDAHVTAIVVEHEDHAMTVGAACDDLPQLDRIWQLDSGCVAELTYQGREISDEVVHRHRFAVQPQSPAVIAYTSGTTGWPKGCVITHANLAYECDTLLKGWADVLAVPDGGQPSVLAFLPMAHVYGLMVAVLCLRGGILLAHQPDLAPEALLPALASFRPTFLFAVPYIFEKLLQKARMAAEEAGRGPVFERAVDVAMRYAEAIERQGKGSGFGPGPWLRAVHAVFDHMVYKRIRAVLGGRVRYAVSGGSPLRRELGLFFAGAGITIYEGYGLTETSCTVTGQPVGRLRFGTVGRPLPGHAIHIAEDGEIWVRGPVVFAGYLGDKETTDAVLRDGWLATGDLGHFDDDGYLTITGRKKDVIVTSGGKTVSLQVLEERLRAHPLVSQCLVVGDDRPYVAALITLDPEALEHWCRLRGKETADSRVLADDPDLRAEIQRAVSMANTAVSRAESIRAFTVLPEEFTTANGLMTPSLKMRRDAIVKAFAAEIEKLYARRPHRSGG